MRTRIHWARSHKRSFYIERLCNHLFLTRTMSRMNILIPNRDAQVEQLKETCRVVRPLIGQLHCKDESVPASGVAEGQPTAEETEAQKKWREG